MHLSVSYVCENVCLCLHDIASFGQRLVSFFPFCDCVSSVVWLVGMVFCDGGRGRYGGGVHACVCVCVHAHLRVSMCLWSRFLI